MYRRTRPIRTTRRGSTRHIYRLTPTSLRSAGILPAGRLEAGAPRSHEPRHLLDAEQVLADCLKVADPALRMLRHGVGVAKAALEGVAVEDRGATGELVKLLDDA